MAIPACSPVRSTADPAIANAASPWTNAPAAQAHLRCGKRRNRSEMNIWGNKAPASRIGTKRPTSAAGAPRAVINQLRTSLGSTRASALLERESAAICAKKFPASSLHALSGMSEHARPSSSIAMASNAGSSHCEEVVISAVCPYLRQIGPHPVQLQRCALGHSEPPSSKSGCLHRRRRGCGRRQRGLRVRSRLHCRPCPIPTNRRGDHRCPWRLPAWFWNRTSARRS